RAAKPGFVRSVLLAHTAGGLDAEGVTLDRGAVEDVILPLGVQAVYAADLPIGEILALEIHDVGTGRGLHDAGVAGLADGIEAPVLKSVEHLALVDLGVQAAFAGVGVGGVFIGQRAEGFGGVFAGQILVKDILGAGLSLGIVEGLGLFIAIFAFGQ